MTRTINISGAQKEPDEPAVAKHDHASLSIYSRFSVFAENLETKSNYFIIL